MHIEHWFHYSCVVNNWAKYVGVLNKCLNNILLVVKIHELLNKIKLPYWLSEEVCCSFHWNYMTVNMLIYWEWSRNPLIKLCSFSTIHGVELSKTSEMLRQFYLANSTEDEFIHYSIHLIGNWPTLLKPSQTPLKVKYYLPNTILKKKYLCSTKLAGLMIKGYKNAILDSFYIILLAIHDTVI